MEKQLKSIVNELKYLNRNLKDIKRELGRGRWSTYEIEGASKGYLGTDVLPDKREVEKYEED